MIGTAVVADSLEAAKMDYTRVLQMEPHNVEATYARGTVQQKLGNTEMAIADYTTVLQLDPNHVKAAYSRAACRNALEQFDKAIGMVMKRI